MPSEQPAEAHFDVALLQNLDLQSAFEVQDSPMLQLLNSLQLTVTFVLFLTGTGALQELVVMLQEVQVRFPLLKEVFVDEQSVGPLNKLPSHCSLRSSPPLPHVLSWQGA
jgi:hypothetical protein